MGLFWDIMWFFLEAMTVMAVFVGVYLAWIVGLENLKLWRYKRANRNGRDIVGM